MSWDEELFVRAKERFEAEKLARKLAQANETERIESEIPRLKQLSEEFAACGVRITRAALYGADAEKELGRIREKATAMRAEQAELLKEHGYPADALRIKYACADCADTGYTDSGMCECLRRVCREEQLAALAAQLPASPGRFADFDSSLYSDAYDEKLGSTQRAFAAYVCNKLKKYADTFSPASPWLLITGESGTGKTFFASCIAREVVRRDYSAEYRTAYRLFAAFEECRFNRESPLTRELERCRRTDLLIIDDIGGEQATAYGVSAFSDLINTRIAENRPTVLAGDIAQGSLAPRYSAQTAARLEAVSVPVSILGKGVARRTPRIGEL